MVNFSELSAFFGKKSNIIVICIISVLVAALAVSVTYCVKRDRAVNSAKTVIAQKEEQIKTADENIKKIQSELEAEKQNNNSLNAEIENYKNEKSQLEGEINGLKQQIELLRAKKASEQAKAAAKAQAPAQQQQTPPGSKVCYLTFDDGPSDNTLKILDILAQYNIKATFFVINSEHIDYIKRIHAEGHTVGLHTNTHKYSKVYESDEAYFSDLNSISNKVESIIGVKSTVIRFPGGSSNVVSKDFCPGLMTRLVNEVNARGYSYFDWNVSSGDAASETPSYTSIRNNILNAAKTKNSICVLMHDSLTKTTTVQALPEVIEGLRDMGYSFAALTPESYGYHHTNLHN